MWKILVYYLHHEFFYAPIFWSRWLALVPGLMISSNADRIDAHKMWACNHRNCSSILRFRRVVPRLTSRVVEFVLSMNKDQRTCRRFWVRFVPVVAGT